MARRLLIPTLASLGALAALTLGAADADAQNLDITTLKPEQLEKRIRAAGWHVVAAPIFTDMPEYRSWIWAITQGPAGGAVGLYVYKDVNAARTLVDILSPNKDTEVIRNRNVVVSVIMTGRPKEARDLMGLLTGSARPPGPQSGLETPNPGSAQSADGGPGVTALPELRFGRLWRAEVLNAALSDGWTLSKPPTVSHDEGYAAVSYQLDADGTSLFMTLYGCGNLACVKEVESTARRTPDALSARRGNTVLVLIAPDHIADARRTMARIAAAP